MQIRGLMIDPLTNMPTGACDLTASINWGDGTTTTSGGVTGSDGAFTVSAPTGAVSSSRPLTRQGGRPSALSCRAITACA